MPRREMNSHINPSLIIDDWNILPLLVTNSDKNIIGQTGDNSHNRTASNITTPDLAKESGVEPGELFRQELLVHVVEVVEGCARGISLLHQLEH